MLRCYMNTLMHKLHTYKSGRTRILGSFHCKARSLYQDDYSFYISNPTFSILTPKTVTFCVPGPTLRLIFPTTQTMFPASSWCCCWLDGVTVSMLRLFCWLILWCKNYATGLNHLLTHITPCACLMSQTPLSCVIIGPVMEAVGSGRDAQQFTGLCSCHISSKACLRRSRQESHTIIQSLYAQFKKTRCASFAIIKITFHFLFPHAYSKTLYPSTDLLFHKHT